MVISLAYIRSTIHTFAFRSSPGYRSQGFQASCEYKHLPNSSLPATTSPINDMELPPGPVYLLRLVPFFAIPSTIVYLCLKLAREQLDVAIPTWLMITAVLLARPALFVYKRYYTRFAEAKAAAANNAILAPHVRESAIHIMTAFGASIKDGYPADIVDEWLNEFGTYGKTVTLRLLTDNRILTAEPENIKAMLATQFDSFDKGTMFNSIFDSLLGEGVFNADGEMWKFHRAMTRPFFTRERISDFDIYDRHCESSLRQAKARLAEGFPIEFQDLVSRFTLDSATEFLFGHDVGSLGAAIPYPSSSSKAAYNSASYDKHPSTVFLKAFTEGQILVSQRSMFGGDWPMTEFWGDTIKPHRKIIDGFTGPLMKEALAKRELELASKNGADVKNTEEDNLLAHLVQHTQDEKILKDELLNLLVAGRDTTMGLLTFAFYMLTEHPDIEKRLREEILDKVGPQGRPTYDHMRDMKFMRAFINEVLRLYPSVPMDSRVSTKGVVWPAKAPGSKPIYVPEGTTCIYSVLIMHRRTDLWGPDAHKFDPDRFLDERVHKYLTPNPFIFCPFNAGPRICLGQQFAYHEATFFLVRLLQQFTGFKLEKSENIQPPADWAKCSGLKGTDKVVPAMHLTLYVKGGMWVRMEELKVADVL
ncbi:cytochrome P450 monooxygenase pc-1 [Crassisporium funariophilum]|nr:cytochrome P450 monooxygenase pc-1 [Crassisporium funariophilum]